MPLAPLLFAVGILASIWIIGYATIQIARENREAKK